MRRGLIPPLLAAGLVASLMLHRHGQAAPPRRATLPDTAAPEPAGAACPIARTRTRAARPVEKALPAVVRAAADPTYLPLVLRVQAPPDRRGDVPVEIVWSVDPASSRAAVSSFRTDAEGRARCRLAPPAPRPPVFAADLAFPTMGTSVTPIPDAGGEVVVPMVQTAWLDVEVDDAHGETVLLELRAPAARSPGDRWHRHRLPGGRARLLVETGVDLVVRASTPSGRTAHASLRAPAEADAAAPCRLELDAGAAVRIAVRGADGRPAAHRGVRVLDRDGWRPVAAGRTDGNGEVVVRLPRSLHARPRADLVLDAGADYTDLVLDGALLRDGGWVEARLTPAPALSAGSVVDPVGEGIPGVRVELQMDVDDAKARAEDRPAWRTVATTETDDGGAFAFSAVAPDGAPLRLYVPGAPEAAPIPVRAGDAHLRIEAPVPARRRR